MISCTVFYKIINVINVSRIFVKLINIYCSNKDITSNNKPDCVEYRFRRINF